MLNKYQFDTLSCCAIEKAPSQRRIAQITRMSLGSANKAISSLRDKGLLNKANMLTDTGRSALAPFKVDNAIILAAGMATRFAPLSFERPKAMFEVRGEILIERLIRQLKESGINDIVIVVGYMKESFFYLEDKYGVTIVTNREYATRNNHSSIWYAREYLSNTYVIPADQHYKYNIFKPYQQNSFCFTAEIDNKQEDQIVTTDRKGRITRIDPHGKNGLYIHGPAFFNREFSKQYLSILEEVYNTPATTGKLWDEVLADHLGQLEFYSKKLDTNVVHEFDFITDLTQFDRDFFANVDSHILDNICKTLNCTRDDISQVDPIKAGLTNLSVLFEAQGVKYVYRHPGNGTDEIINREAEAFSLGVAKELGLDDTFIYEDPAEGWKISRFIEGCTEFDYKNMDHVAKGLAMARKLHTSGKTSPWSFDFADEANNIVRLLKEHNYPLPPDFSELETRVTDLAGKMRADQGEPVLCHNDFYGPNFLVRGDDMWLIDWEYSAMGDYACDLGNFISQGSGYSVQETIDVLPLYYGRPVTPQEERHCLAAVGLVGWYWYVWAMYKEAMGNPVGEWLYIWYKAAKQFTSVALKRY